MNAVAIVLRLRAGIGVFREELEKFVIELFEAPFYPSFPTRKGNDRELVVFLRFLNEILGTRYLELWDEILGEYFHSEVWW